MAKKAYMGKAPLTLVPLATGNTLYVYAGHLAPEGIVPADLKRFVEEGFLVEVDVEDPPPVEDPLNPVDEEPENVRPPKTANKDTWVAFRLGEDGNALTEEQLSGLTADQLKDDDEVAKARAAAAQS